MYLAVQRYLRTFQASMTRWRSPNSYGDCNHLNASTVARSSNNTFASGRRIPQLRRSFLAILLYVMFSAGAVAEEPRDSAIALLREAAQIPEANIGTSLRMAKAFVEAGDSKTAGPLLVKVWDASLKVKEKDFPLRLVLLEIAQCQAKIGLENDAIKAVQQLPSSFDRAIVLNSIAAVLAGQGKATAAFQTVDLIPAQERFQENVPGTHRDFALTELSNVFSERHNYVDAMKAVRLIGEGVQFNEEEKRAAEQQRASGLFWVFYNQLDSGDIKSALQTVHSFTTQSRRESALCRTLRCGGDRIDLVTAREIFKDIHDQSQKDIGATSLAERLCRLKLLDEATNLVDQIQSKSEKAIGLLELAVGHAANGDIEKTRAFLDQSTALDQLDGNLKQVGMRRIVEAFVDSGHFDHGQKFAEEQSDLETRSTCYQAIAIAQWKQGRKVIAQQAILESRKAASDISYAYRRSVRLQELAVALLGVDAKEEAIATLKLAHETGCDVESAGGTDVSNLIEIAELQATIGDSDSCDATIEDAYTAARKYPDDTYSGSLVAKVIQAQSQFGNSTHAIQIAHEEKSPEARAGLLVAAAGGLLAHSSPLPPKGNNCGNKLLILMGDY